MESGSGNVTISIRYRPGNLLIKPPIKISVDGKDKFSLSNEGVKRLSLEPGMHDFKMRCGLKSRTFNIDVESMTKITIGFCRNCGKIKARADTVNSLEELDFDRNGY